MSKITEEECLRRINLATEELREELRAAREESRVNGFRAAVAEWAIRGIAAWNVRVAISPEEMYAKETDLLNVARYIGRNAAEQLLHSAELHFKQHAEFAELKADYGRLKYAPINAEPGLPHKVFWPKNPPDGK